MRKTLETMKARRYCDILLNGEFQKKQIYFENCKNLFELKMKYSNIY